VVRASFLFTGPLLALLLPASDAASTKEAMAVSTFEAVCLLNADRPGQIPDALLTMGANETKEIKAARSLAPLTGRTFKALLAPFTGRTFELKDEAGDFLIVVTDTGACSLYSREAEGLATETLLKERMPNRQLGKQAAGSETHSTYAVSYPVADRTIHALVFVDRPTDAKATGVRLSALAEQSLQARRQKSPPWP